MIPAKRFRRSVFVFILLNLLFCLIVRKFYGLQVLEKDRWRRSARAQHYFTVDESCKRGRIFLRSLAKKDHLPRDVVLACDVGRYHLYVDPFLIPERYKEEVAEMLSDLLVTETKEAIHARLMKRSRSRKMKMWLDEEDKDRINTLWIRYAKGRHIAVNALYFIRDYRRSHPLKTLLGSVVHTVREEKDPETGAPIPTGGLELAYDGCLNGKRGKRVQFRSPRYPLGGGTWIRQPEDGADLYLTIDPVIQAIAEEEIEYGVREANAKRGWAVMMDPHTGEIVALAQFPGFDPSRYGTYYSDPDLIEHTKVHAVTDSFEPGSTIKPITATIAYLANKELARRGRPPLFMPLEPVKSEDGRFPGRSTPIRDVGHHRYLNIHLALWKSSNIYFADLARKIVDKLGLEWYERQLAEVFGFGRRTGIELPSESPGFLPGSGTNRSTGKMRCSGSTPYSLAMGYNLQATGLQMVRAYAMLANGGREVHPRLVRKMVKGGKILFERRFSPSAAEPVLDGATVEELVYALKGVTTPGGVGVRAAIPGYTGAGKTGTTEKAVGGRYSKRNHFSGFVGFAPADPARFVLLIAIDEPEYRFLPGIGRTYFGGRCAAPVFSRIMRRTFDYLNIPEDDPHGYPAPDPRFDPDRADRTKQMRNLRELYARWNVR
ncbi:MAG: penicillin-binding protein 2 [Simkaniaceae bacterium]|nr:penicillin-binding protein 2 [Simkaniaceae bacterium]